jgi:hypothetical protein
MNQFTIKTNGPDLDTLQARVGVRIAGRLSEQAQNLPHDVSERLRFAREQALQRAQQVRTATETTPVVVAAGGGVGTMAIGRLGGSSWWVRLASVMPLIVLVGGLLLIQRVHDRASISAAAEVDTQILSDDLPPAAYNDPGFVEFLKTPQQ